MLDETLSSILVPKGWIPAADSGPWSRDWLNRHGKAPLGVARPASTAEVVAVMAAAHAAGVAVVPQGGNTELCATAAVAGKPGAIVLNLSRMAAIDPPDLTGDSITVEAGVVLAQLHEVLEGSGQMFPLHLGAEGSAQIGGLIGTNAGCQLRKLFCGSGGTLGIVTRAVLRLHPALRQRVTALLALPDCAATLAFGTQLRAEAAEFLQAMEFFSETGLGLALRHVPNLVWPLQTRAEAYLLFEFGAGSARIGLEDLVASLLAEGMAQGLILDGALASSAAQRAAFWRLREEQPECQRLEGAQLKHDIAVPPARIADFIVTGADLCARAVPGVRINPFGHLGDGNIHYNLTPPLGQTGFLGQETKLAHELAGSMSGSFAADHGLGRTKTALADTLRPKAERDLQRQIKATLDPAGLLNPGAIVVEIDDVERIPEILSRAWITATTGRPGPVVVALPEDMLTSLTDTAPLTGPARIAEPAPEAGALAEALALLKSAKRPAILLGGCNWTEAGKAALQAFAEGSDIPVVAALRYQDMFDNHSPSYAGDLGLGLAAGVRKTMAEADVILALNTRFGEISTEGYTLFQVPQPKQQIIHVHGSMAEIGKIYIPTLGINAKALTPRMTLSQMRANALAAKSTS